MQSTMQDHPLTIRSILDHGAKVYGGSRVITATQDSSRSATFSEVAGRAARLASALRRLGIRPGDRVATLAWNAQEHLEAYFAVPAMGAVLHTLNLRLFPEQIVYIANHAEDKAILVSDSLVPLLSKIRDKLTTVEHIIVMGRDMGDLKGALSYEQLVAAEETHYDWPKIDERSAASMCYTSGTTGDPKGVVYSHRSIYLHSLLATSGAAFSLGERDRVLPIVPMFHVNAWGIPYASWMVGADVLLPDRYLQGEALTRFMESERATFAASVPLIWNDILRVSEGKHVDLSSLRMVVCGGAAVPRSLIERFRKRFGVTIVQAWGMTETSPIASIAFPPKGCDSDDEMSFRVKTGRAVPGVELRLMDGDTEVPRDGKGVGEIEVRGPWITGGYYKQDAPEKFHDGWLRTGDVGTIDEKGFVQITDRAKDVIKSGGEWISSVELENAIMGHESVHEAAVVGVPDEKWDERPLACVVLKDGAKADPSAIAAYLEPRVARWWLPEKWTFMRELPKTSVGKFDKKVIRALYAKGEIEIVTR